MIFPTMSDIFIVGRVQGTVLNIGNIDRISEENNVALDFNIGVKISRRILLKYAMYINR